LVFRRGCRKGDYYRYLAEFKSGDEREEAADLSKKAYEVMSDLDALGLGLCFVCWLRK
jgi:hypothetical protein